MVFDQLNQKITRLINVAILAEEPLGWDSGKNYFPAILDNYNWTINGIKYVIKTQYIFDKDILKGKLDILNYDVLLVPGGGVGDGEAVVKGFNLSFKVKKWKKNIADFIKNGGGYVGICGGTALITRLSKDQNNNLTSFLERQYDKSAIGLTCVKSYYNNLAFPLFYPLQSKYPEKIGATAYVFSFSPGRTLDGKRIFSGGVPIDFQILKDNPIFSDFTENTERIRWWGGPALIVPSNPDREVKILARYPKKELSEDEKTRIFAWKYIGGIYGILLAIFKAFKFIKKNNEKLKNLAKYTYYFAGDWKQSNKIIELNYSNKACITAEMYPNENKGRIILCAAHPEYMIWWGGKIKEVNNPKFNCIANGFHQWNKIKSLKTGGINEFTHTWWIVRRMVAWAAKVPDHQLPPILKGQLTDKGREILSKKIFWNGTILHQMKDI